MKNKTWTETDDKQLKRLLKKFKECSVPDPSHDIQFVFDLIRGQEGEAIISEALKGEIKRDYRAFETGNIFVEYQSRGKPSGIETTEADYWIFLLSDKVYQDEIFIGVKTKRLKKIVDALNYSVNGGDNKTSKGKLVPLKKLLKAI